MHLYILSASSIELHRCANASNQFRITTDFFEQLRSQEFCATSISKRVWKAAQEKAARAEKEFYQDVRKCDKEFSRLLGKLAKLDKQLLQDRKLQELLEKLQARRGVWRGLLRGRARVVNHRNGSYGCGKFRTSHKV